jgi:hypothetical protein
MGSITIKSSSLTTFTVPDFTEIRSVVSRRNFEEKYYLSIMCSFYELCELNGKLLLEH